MRKTLRTVTATALAVVVVAASAGTVLAAGSTSSVLVTNSSDSGPGSFRAAIDKANANANVGKIVFRFGLAPILLAGPVEFTGGHSLAILGNGAVLDGGLLDPSAADAFLASGGGNLSVSLLTIRNAPQQGLTYQVPGDATGTKRVVLVGVRILDNDGHGVLINDQTFPEEAGDPDADPQVPPNAAGSGASLEVSVTGSRFDNGRGALDRDGLRVNEGGLGNLNAVISLIKVERSGGDGIELDERGDGDVVFNVSGSTVTRNGDFDIATDPDDGMDVDESGHGSVIGKVLASSASDNFEEGFDLNENDAGDFSVDMTLVEASRNREEGIDFEEDDDFPGGGDLITTLVGVKADGNTTEDGDAGLKIREKGVGSLTATVRNAQANGNQADGIQVREDAADEGDDAGNLTATVERSTTSGNDGDGIEFEENGAGNQTATVVRSTTNSNTDGDGVEFDENGGGDLTSMVSRGNSGGNSGAGVRADQVGGGTGTLTVTNMTFIPANAGGDIVSNVPLG